MTGMNFMSRIARRLMVTAACLAISVMPVKADEKSQANGITADGFVPLFNGENLDGWKKVGGGATYRVEDRCIVGEVGPGANTFLRTEKTYANFTLKVDVKLDVPGNSGIQFRSHQKEGDGKTFGYQCEIDPSARAWTGGIYDESRRGWINSLEKNEAARKAFKVDGWNHFVIEANGPVIRTWVNNVPCANLVDPADSEGFIALQVHAGKAGVIRWRDIKIKETPATVWKPLWDGKDFNGFKEIGAGRWKIVDGVIEGTHVEKDTDHGHLITNDRYRDFAVRLKFKSLAGNSGLYFRVDEGGPYGVRGMQAEIDPANDIGGLYETDGRGWLSKPTSDEIKKFFKPKEWNEMVVVAIGHRQVVFVNNAKVTDITDTPSREVGNIALQLHGGQNVEVSFKDLEIMRLDDVNCCE